MANQTKPHPLPGLRYPLGLLGLLLLLLIWSGVGPHSRFDWFVDNSLGIVLLALAVTIGGDQGINYIGSQGDPWDAQKDMLLAGLGALIALSVTFIVNWQYNSGWREEWRKSFTIKSREPLGEVRIREMTEGESTK